MAQQGPTSVTASGESNGKPRFSFSNGILTASTALQLHDADIIAVTGAQGDGDGYNILSLAPEGEASAETHPQPFELLITKATHLPEDFLDIYHIKDVPSHLEPSCQLSVVVSTLSGTGLATSFFEKILRPVLQTLSIDESQYSVDRTENTQSVHDLAKTTLLENANGGDAQTVVVLSGDGGIVDIINGLLESGERSSDYTPPVICQIPLGTGNALFHSLHRSSTTPSIYVQALRTLLTGQPKPLPTFKATFSPGARLLTHEGQSATPLSNNTLYGAVVASYGLHSTLVADSDTTEYRKHGDKRFGLVAKDLLYPEDGSPHAYQADVTLLQDGKQNAVGRQEHGYILATLVSNLEKTFTISPETKPLDGVLRVVNFGPLSGDESMEIMKAAYQDGKHIGMEGVGYDAVEGLDVKFLEVGESWKWRRCCVDGLIVGVEEGGWMKVRVMEKGSEAVQIVSDV
ncbi:hypothetical protein GLAREA_07989 [Glarea lozoyensis ATCC 20868]|uniref:DAGKc domain-containing protein n=1 Tax=Glarea lozoyensis (strain ATCC 20868 / MF5171) TaxID=1116229 RepID=S3CFV7_GLAL2|nr:uncharacterized protein GLAREA_07989 [Glarea lozoyensis ATCC 20868]EPE24139.1 hypothetical protein GLAREA_07989 [Glarea lozoyensis ATCC 20868]